jgi:HEXXH motif-containing protein
VPTVHRDRFAPAAYRLSRDRFDDLATGRGDADTVRFLEGTQYSRRLLMLRALYDEGLPGLDPLPPVDHAWDVMAAAQQLDEPAFRTAVMHPQIGNWGAYALREHRKAGEGMRDDAAPRWADVGQIHAVAMVVAVRCGLSWRTRVPLRRGAAMLPGMGQARFASARPWDFAEAETADGRVRLSHDRTEIVVPADPSRDADGWWGLRTLRAGDDPALEVVLEDLDPFRDLADPVEPERLAGDEVARWEALLDQAWDLLSRDDPPTARAMTIAVSSLAPLPRAARQDGEETRSASTAEAFGAVVLSTPPTAIDLAVALVHEYQHIKLGCLLQMVTFHHEGERTNLYAPWRDDPRPLGGLVQGIYAFHGISSYLRIRAGNSVGSERRAAQFAYVLTRSQTAIGLEQARDSGGLTEVGEEFLDGLATAMRPWFDDDVPADIVRLAGLAIRAHRTTWCLEHRRPAPEAVAASVRAWSRGEPIDPVAADAATVEAPLEPPRLSTTWSGPLRRAVNGAVPATTPTGALVGGDAAAARTGFLARVAADPDDLTAWTGLGLACAELGEADAARALADRPDLVRAIYLKLLEAGSAPPPDRLAAWAGQAP